MQALYTGLFRLLVVVGLLLPAHAVASPGPFGQAGVDELKLPPDSFADDVEAAAPSLDELRDQIRRMVADLNPAGLSVAMIEDGRVVWSAGFGLSDRESGERTGVDTMYRVGSLSKTVISLGVLALVEDGRLRLDDPVSKYLPDLQADNPHASESPITVEMLLEHTSGFDEMHFNEMFVADGESDLPLEEVLRINPRSRKVRWRPGTRHGYSQPGYTVAARVIEVVSGEPFEDFIDARVFGPLEMHDASFRYSPEIADKVATGYWSGPRPQPVEHHRLHHRAGGGLYVSADEMSHVVEMLINDGRYAGRQVFAPESIARMERGETLPYRGLLPDYGLGNYRGEIRGARKQGHGGWMPGFDSVYRYFPELDAGYVMLSNATGPTDHFWPIDAAMLRYLLAEVDPPEPPVYEPSPAELARHTGTYVVANPHVGFLAVFEELQTLKIGMRDGQLFARGQGYYTPLLPTGPDTFRMPDDFDSTIMFTQIDGDDVVVSHLSVFRRCGRMEAMLRGPLQTTARVLIGIALITPLLWLPLLLLNGYRHIRGIRLWAYPSLSAWCFTLMVYYLNHTGVERLGDANARTVAVFLFSWGFGVFALVGLLHAWRRLRIRYPYPSRLVRLYSLATCLALTGLAAHFARHGFIGLRTWMW